MMRRCCWDKARELVDVDLLPFQWKHAGQQRHTSDVCLSFGARYFGSQSALPPECTVRMKGFRLPRYEDRHIPEILPIDYRRRDSLVRLR
jgi:hypothetical protein